MLRRCLPGAVVRAWACGLVVCLLCAALDWHRAAAQSGAPPAGARSVAGAAQPDLAKLFDEVVSTIQDKFFDESQLREINWQERARAARPAAVASPTVEEAVRRINALLGELKTSHTELLTPDQYAYYFVLDIVGIVPDASGLLDRRFWGSSPYYPGIGAFTRELDGHHFVQRHSGGILRRIGRACCTGTNCSQ